MLTPEEEETLEDVEVHPQDREWINPHAAAVVLSRAKDGSEPVSWEDVKRELAEMERLGI